MLRGVIRVLVEGATHFREVRMNVLGIVAYEWTSYIIYVYVSLTFRSVLWLH